MYFVWVITIESTRENINKNSHDFLNVLQKVYQNYGNSNLYFIADRDKVHSVTKLCINKLTDAHNKLKKGGKDICEM